MVERKEGREREREKGGFLDSQTYCADVLSPPTTRCPWIRDRRMESREMGEKKEKKKKRGAWQEAFEKLFSASTVSRGFPTPIPRHNWMG